ncbi:arylsulfatase [Flexithrix dorotheae]|uniref:arylsulfatase n=1 Tax=Flexithrix dorotheae TaxID=70993 RepID=UPI0003741BE4|nr:arylsulfatase [Flexithrix dorotheae]
MLKPVQTLSFIFFISFLISSCKEEVKTTEAKKPNVIIILTDDQAWGDLSINGNQNLKTPNIDKLGQEGAAFNNFYVCSVCSPTRAELLTGRYNFRSGIYSTGGGGERMDMDETTIADIFKQAGYATAAYGKWHNGMQYPYHPNARGFDDFYGFCSGHWGDYFSPMLEHNGEIVKGDGFLIDDFTNHGLDFMEKNKDNPFLLYLPFNTPHTPFQAPDRNWDKFKNKEINQLEEPRNEDIVETRAALAMCENIDENVGRIISKTKELGIDDNTIVLFFSDNGPARKRWNGGMLGKKGSTHEGGIRSPLLMKWPASIKPGKLVEQVTSVTDLLPTLMEMCGINFQTEKQLDGISVKPTILDEKAEWEDRYIFNDFQKKSSVRNQNYRLAENDGLYNITEDRNQTKDLSEELPELKAEMVKVRNNFLQQKIAELPAVDERPFYLGHPAMKFTQIPARDGTAHGAIKRSNKYPNCSFFTNWTNVNDSISWQVNVPEAGKFKVQLYYTCPEADAGSAIQLTVGKNKLQTKISESFDPPLRGMEKDLAPRIESYVKDWKKVNIGEIQLDKGDWNMSLKALEMPGNSVMDFRLFIFERI